MVHIPKALGQDVPLSSFAIKHDEAGERLLNVEIIRERFSLPLKWETLVGSLVCLIN